MPRSWECLTCEGRTELWSASCPSCGAIGMLAPSKKKPPQGDDECAFARVQGVGRISTNSQVVGGNFAGVGTEPSRALDAATDDLGRVDVDVSAIGEIRAEKIVRRKTGIDAFDRMLGGGAVKGSAVIVSGEPGAGKSTLLMQALASYVEKTGHRAVYVIGPGEGGKGAIVSQLARLGIGKSRRVRKLLSVVQHDDVRAIAVAIEASRARLCVVDSAQAFRHPDVSGTVGSTAQAKTIAHACVRACGASGCSLFLVCQVTKNKSIAGPKAIEHVCDATLHLGIDPHNPARRILVARKNRHGDVAQVARFMMSSVGLSELTENEEKGAGDAMVGSGVARALRRSSSGRAHDSVDRSREDSPRGDGKSARRHREQDGRSGARKERTASADRVSSHR